MTEQATTDLVKRLCAREAELHGQLQRMIDRWEAQQAEIERLREAAIHAELVLRKSGMGCAHDNCTYCDAASKLRAALKGDDHA